MARLTPNTSEKKRWSWKRFGGKFLVISILVHVLFLSGATYLVVQRIQAKRKLTFTAGPPAPPEQQVEHKVQLQKEQTMSAPQMVKRITTTGLGKITLPEMPEMPTQTDDVKPMKMTSQSGLGNGTSMMMGAGGAGGLGAGISLPSIMADRCSAEGRAKSIQENGGDQKDEDAIIKGLRWLKQNQNPNGSWGSKYKGAMTGLALLSYLGHCERPNSGEFGPTVKNGIDRVVAVGTAHKGNLSDGAAGNDMVYQHAISTYALGEAYIVAKDDAITPVLKDAIGIILSGQGADGGWSYGYSKMIPSDTSVTCWQIQGLKTAHYSGLNIDGVDTALDKSMDDLVRVQDKNGVFGYRIEGKPNPLPTGDLTGAGVFCLLAWHHGKGDAVRKGLKFIREGYPPAPKKKPVKPIYEYKNPATNLYAWYYDTQACFQAGGGAWDWWNERFQRELTENQNPDGSWAPSGGDPVRFWTGSGADLDSQIYRTTMCILMLEVYFRYTSASKAEGAVQ